VPRTLAVKVPDNVSFESAAFTTLGAVALQGVRQGEVVVGQYVMVIGLGVIGQLTTQIAKAAGCNVFAVDLVEERVELALRLGASAGCLAEAAAIEGMAFTGGRGFDTVLITADTPSSQPVVLAGEVARDRAIVVAVGAVGLTLPRREYYRKELDLRLSRSYGPGRYDPEYEEKGQDYPYGYVRWTEQRNMEAFLRLVSSDAVNVEPLITHRIPIQRVSEAYDVVAGDSGSTSLGVVLTYDYDSAPTNAERIALNGHGHRLVNWPAAGTASAGWIEPQPAVCLGLVGAGNFANSTLLPATSKLEGLNLTGIVSATGLSARHTGERFGFEYCASELTTLLRDERLNWLAIATRHNLHAPQAIAGMQAGKDVFVEKPLALNRMELAEVMRTQRQTQRRLMVGFNRRFAPFVRELRRWQQGTQRSVIAAYRVNAGRVPPGHWTLDPEVGGGRIVGEVCHFIDLLQFLINAPPTEVTARSLRSGQAEAEDELLVTISFKDGSLGTLVYTAGGDRSFGKERLEVFGGGRAAVLDDFRSLELVANGKHSRRRERLRPDKGHRGQWEALIAVTRSGAPSPIGLDEVVATHLATFAVLESLNTRRSVPIDLDAFWRDVDPA
jgi:predicted dehydrogenase